MKAACYYRYVQNKDLRRKLFKTAGTILIDACFEGDTVWGIGTTTNNPKFFHTLEYKGRNQHGIILTKLRDYLMELEKFQDEVKDAENDNKVYYEETRR